MKIMIVDDHRPSLSAMRQMLSLMGSDCLGYESPLSALSAFSGDRNGFDLVFTDYSMNEMNGVDFVMEIITMRPEQHVVLMTGGKLPASHQRLMEALHINVMMKPLDTAALLSVVESGMSYKQEHAYQQAVK
ncbi:MAG: response regulator [Desulfovibrionaceae bacterium]